LCMPGETEKLRPRNELLLAEHRVYQRFSVGAVVGSKKSMAGIPRGHGADALADSDF